MPNLRAFIRINMVNWVGMDEAGIDGGGIFKEFLCEVIKTALDPSRGLFAATKDHFLYPNPSASTIYPNDFQDHFYFVGRLIGKANFFPFLYIAI